MTYGIGLISVKSDCCFVLFVFVVPSNSNGFKLIFIATGLFTIIEDNQVNFFFRTKLTFSRLTLSEWLYRIRKSYYI